MRNLSHYTFHGVESKGESNCKKTANLRLYVILNFIEKFENIVICLNYLLNLCLCLNYQVHFIFQNQITGNRNSLKDMVIKKLNM